MEKLAIKERTDSLLSQISVVISYRLCFIGQYSELGCMSVMCSLKWFPTNPDLLGLAVWERTSLDREDDIASESLAFR